MCVYPQACEGQKITYRRQFSPSTVWDLKIKSSSPDLVASTLTHGAISPALKQGITAVTNVLSRIILCYGGLFCT